MFIKDLTWLHYLKMPFKSGQNATTIEYRSTKEYSYTQISGTYVRPPKYRPTLKPDRLSIGHFSCL